MVVKKKEPFLDLGANAVPHPKATHAVDMESKSKIIKSYIPREYTGLIHKVQTTKEKFEQRLKQMDYKFSFNYNTQKFPWPDNSFKVVNSNASLEAYGKIPAYKEAYRVLKHGGKLIFDADASKENIKKLTKILHHIGFVKIHITQVKKVLYSYKNKNVEGFLGKMVAFKP